VVTRSVPQSIKLGLTASIGLFVAVLGFRNAGLVLANAKTNALMLGDFLSPGALVALCGLFLAIALQARKSPAQFCGRFSLPPWSAFRWASPDSRAALSICRIR
jgi:xanthine/uracil/vitamin C permease (AzgA family)